MAIVPATFEVNKLLFHFQKYYLMKVEQIYTGCLAETAYYIKSNGEVVIIDPLRERNHI